MRIFAFVLAFVALFAALPAQAQQENEVIVNAPTIEYGRWYRAESPNFIVYGDRSERQVRDAAAMLEDVDTVLRFVTRINPPPASENKLEVYLVRGTPALQQVEPRAGPGIGGFYRSGPDLLAAYVIYTDSEGMDRETVLYHEYAHHFMLHYFAYAYPHWYIEGFAEVVSTIEIDGRRATFGDPASGRSENLATLGMMPIRELFSPPPAERRTGIWAARFYASSWFAALYFTNHPEQMRGLMRYVEALGNGGDLLESFEPAFGMTPEQMADDMRRYRNGRASVMTIQLPQQRADVSVTRMPRSADGLLLRVARMRHLGRIEDEPLAELRREVEREAAPYPNDRFAQRALAYLAYISKDRDATRARTEALLATDENDHEMRYLLGRSYLDEATEAEGEARADAVRAARRQFVRAFRVAPGHHPTLYQYALTYAGGPGPMAAEHLDIMARSLELAPRINPIRLTLARELMEAQHFDQAIGALRPLLFAPHDERSTARARALFAAAQNREPPPPEEPPKEEDEDD